MPRQAWVYLELANAVSWAEPLLVLCGALLLILVLMQWRLALPANPGPCYAASMLRGM
jgi:hypothetical protein